MKSNKTSLKRQNIQNKYVFPKFPTKTWIFATVIHIIIFFIFSSNICQNKFDIRKKNQLTSKENSNDNHENSRHVKKYFKIILDLPTAREMAIATAKRTLNLIIVSALDCTRLKWAWRPTRAKVWRDLRSGGRGFIPGTAIHTDWKNGWLTESEMWNGRCVWNMLEKLRMQIVTTLVPNNIKWKSHKMDVDMN